MATATDAMKAVMRLCGYEFPGNDLHILIEALRAGKNKNLAVIGDRVMGLLIADTGYDNKRSRGTASDVSREFG